MNERNDNEQQSDIRGIPQRTRGKMVSEMDFRHTQEDSLGFRGI